MKPYKIKLCTALILLMKCCMVFADDYSLWKTPITCKNLRAEFSISCKEGSEEGEPNNCKMPQNLIFFDKNGTVTKRYSIPAIVPKDMPAYKKAGSLNTLFSDTWECFEYKGEPFIKIYSATMSHSPNNEVVNFFSATGDWIIDEKLEASLIMAADEILNHAKNLDIYEHGIKGYYQK